MSAVEQESILRLLGAMLCGLFVGAEREYRGKPAGLRTNMLICLGSCLFMLVSEFVAKSALKSGFTTPDPGRIAAQVVTGIGFLGAGAIIRHRGGISGLTTAASIWGMSAVGLAMGAGMYKIAFLSSFGYIVTVELFYYLAQVIRLQSYRTMAINVIIKKEVKIADIRKVFRTLKLSFANENTEKVLGEIHYKSLIYMRGDLEEIITNEISKIKGVRDVQVLNTDAEI